MCLYPCRCVNPLTAAFIYALLQDKDSSGIFSEKIESIDSTTVITPELEELYVKQEKEARRL